MWNDSLWIKDKGWTSVRDYIEEVPDFPIKGISFKDISPLLADENMFKRVVAEMGDILVKITRLLDWNRSQRIFVCISIINQIWWWSCDV